MLTRGSQAACIAKRLRDLFMRDMPKIARSFAALPANPYPARIRLTAGTFALISVSYFHMWLSQIVG
jgi:hypothetical protein